MMLLYWAAALLYASGAVSATKAAVVCLCVYEIDTLDVYFVRCVCGIFFSSLGLNTAAVENNSS